MAILDSKQSDAIASDVQTHVLYVTQRDAIASPPNNQTEKENKK